MYLFCVLKVPCSEMLWTMPENVDCNRSKSISVHFFTVLSNSFPVPQPAGTEEVSMWAAGSAGDPPPGTRSVGVVRRGLVTAEAFQTGCTCCCFSLLRVQSFFLPGYTLLCAFLFGLRE